MDNDELKKLIELSEKFKREITKDCCGYVWRTGDAMSKALSGDFICLVDSQLKFNEGK